MDQDKDWYRLFVEEVLGGDEGILIMTTTMTKGRTSSCCYNQGGDWIPTPPNMPPPLCRCPRPRRRISARLRCWRCPMKGFRKRGGGGRDHTGRTSTSEPKPAPVMEWEASMATITKTTGKTELVHPDKMQWRVGGGFGGRGDIPVDPHAATAAAIVLSLSSSVKVRAGFDPRSTSLPLPQMTTATKTNTTANMTLSRIPTLMTTTSTMTLSELMTTTTTTTMRDVSILPWSFS